MENTPLISVITVTKNALAGLKKTGDSITNQTFKHYEWVIVDGASDDGSLAFLKTTQGRWVSEPDDGLYDAMNKGLAMSQGEYVMFLNAGDVFNDSHSLSLIAQTCTKERPEFIYGDYAEQTGQGTYLRTARPHARIESGMITSHQAMVYNKQALGQLRYNLRYKISADYDLTYRFLKRGIHVCYINAPLCIFESGGLSQQNVSLGRREQFEIRKDGETGLFKNLLVFAKQALASFMRAYLPALYWRVRSSGNSAPAILQNQNRPCHPKTPV